MVKTSGEERVISGVPHHDFKIAESSAENRVMGYFINFNKRSKAKGLRGSKTA
jgi:hypothetical protein